MRRKDIYFYFLFFSEQTFYGQSKIQPHKLINFIIIFVGCRGTNCIIQFMTHVCILIWTLHIYVHFPQLKNLVVQIYHNLLGFVLLSPLFPLFNWVCLSPPDVSFPKPRILVWSSSLTDRSGRISGIMRGGSTSALQRYLVKSVTPSARR